MAKRKMSEVVFGRKRRYVRPVTQEELDRAKEEYQLRGGKITILVPDTIMCEGDRVDRIETAILRNMFRKILNRM